MDIRIRKCQGCGEMYQDWHRDGECPYCKCELSDPATVRERLDKFTEGVRELGKRWGFVIGGCGCCGSPWIEDTETNEHHDCMCSFLDYRKGDK